MHVNYIGILLSWDLTFLTALGDLTAYVADRGLHLEQQQRLGRRSWDSLGWESGWGTARAGTRWDETQGWDSEDGGKADRVCGWCDSQDTSSPLFLQPLMFAHCRLHHCYPPGFPSTLQPSHRVWPSLCSQSNHTMQKAFLMKHIPSKQPRSPHFFLLPSFFPLGSYKEMPSSTERGSQPPCPSPFPGGL